MHTSRRSSKSPMHTALIKSHASIRQQKRIMCTGFADQGGVDAWAYKGLGQDIPNCAYYLNKKLPIVAYATVQMQSNAIQVAGAASASPTPTPPPGSATPTTPTTPLTPAPNTPTTPAPAPVAPTPAPDTPAVPTPAPVAGVTTPEEPIACEAASVAPANTMALMGPMTQKQTLLWQQALQQKQMAQLIKPQASIILPGPIPLPIPAPIIGGPKPIPVDPTDPGGPTYTSGPKLPTFPVITPPISILPIIIGIINICIPKSPTADSLTKAHKDAAGDKTKPGYGGQCKPDQFDDLDSKKNQACNAATSQGGCKPASGSGVITIDVDKANAWDNCAATRNNLAKSCFMGGDSEHENEIKKAKQVAEQCRTGIKQ